MYLHNLSTTNHLSWGDELIEAFKAASHHLLVACLIFEDIHKHRQPCHAQHLFRLLSKRQAMYIVRLCVDHWIVRPFLAAKTTGRARVSLPRSHINLVRHGQLKAQIHWYAMTTPAHCSVAARTAAQGRHAYPPPEGRQLCGPRASRLRWQLIHRNFADLQVVKTFSWVTTTRYRADCAFSAMQTIRTNNATPCRKFFVTLPNMHNLPL